MNTTLKFAVGSLIGATAISFSLGALAQDITGAGATFPASSASASAMIRPR